MILSSCDLICVLYSRKYISFVIDVIIYHMSKKHDFKHSNHKDVAFLRVIFHPD